MSWSMLKAPPRPGVMIAAAGYGMLDGAPVGHRAQARLWVVVDPDPDAPVGSPLAGATGRLVAAWNGTARSGEPDVVYLDLPGEIEHADLMPARWTITLDTGETVRLLVAPCVCGAGAVGTAPPSPEPHRVVVARTDTGDLAWLADRR